MKLLCLANSYKEGGRCIAGIVLDEQNKPQLEAGKPIWIRPICKTGHGQIPLELCEKITPLDIIEIQDTHRIGEGYQSENTTFDEKEISVIGRGTKALIEGLANDYSSLIFINHGKAIHSDSIDDLNHSLMLVRLTDFKIKETKNPGRVNPQIRLEFTHKNNLYDFPITDPVFLDSYSMDKTLLDNTDSIDVVLSIAVLHNGWHSKLVATILY